MSKLLKDQHKKEGVVALGIALLVGASFGLSSALFTNTSHTRQAVLGASIEQNSVTLTATGVSIYPTDVTSQIRRVSVNVTLVNNSGKPLTITPGYQMILLDNTGVVHPVTAAYLPAGTSIGGVLQNGATWKQAVDFDLSATQQPAAFIYQADGASEQLKVKL